MVQRSGRRPQNNRAQSGSSRSRSSDTNPLRDTLRNLKSVLDSFTKSAKSGLPSVLETLGGAMKGLTGRAAVLGRGFGGLLQMFSKAAGPIGIVTTAIVGLSIGLIKLFDGIGKNAIRMRDLSDITGVSVRTFDRSSAGLTAVTTGMDQAQKVASSLATVYRNVIDSFEDPVRFGTGDVINFFTKGLGSIGIGLEKFKKTGGDAIETAKLVAAQLASGAVDEDTARRALRSQFDDETATEVFQLATNPDKLIEAQRRASEKLTLSDKARASYESFSQSISRLSISFANGLAPVLEFLAPQIDKVTRGFGWLADKAGEARRWIGDLIAENQTFFGVLQSVAGAIGQVVGWVAKFIGSGIKASFEEIGAAIGYVDASWKALGVTINKIGTVWNLIVESMKFVFYGFVGGFLSGVLEITKAVNSIPGVGKLIPDDKLAGFENFVEGVNTKTRESGEKIKQYTSELAQAYVDAGVPGEFQEAGRRLQGSAATRLAAYGVGGSNQQQQPMFGPQPVAESLLQPRVVEQTNYYNIERNEDLETALQRIDKENKRQVAELAR